ncbi:MAG: antibiotic biosynthesis monooxygenase [Magnetospirillum sp. WYHS-4]
MGRQDPEQREFVALTRFSIADGMEDSIKEAFRNRPNLAEMAAGFVRMDVLDPKDRPQELWLVTHWVDQASFEAWHRSHVDHDSHAGIPPGLKLIPAEPPMPPVTATTEP